MSGLTPDQVRKIQEYIRNQQLIHAIKLYREATGVGLAEAKSAVEAMTRDEAVEPPSGTMDYDNPVLEEKIRSLLARNQKINAVKIYREEYGVGLKEAKDAVDRIQVSMRSGSSSMNLPYEPAISADPFADDERPGGRRLVMLVAAVAIILCGLGIFFLLANG